MLLNTSMTASTGSKKDKGESNFPKRPLQTKSIQQTTQHLKSASLGRIHLNYVELESVVSWLEKRLWQPRWYSIPAKFVFHFRDEILQFRKTININKGLRFRTSLH